MNKATFKDYYNDYEAYRFAGLSGLYIPHSALLKEIDSLSNLNIHEIGCSEEGRSIKSVQLGTGDTRIMIWSQMHGNESTGTKSIFDLFCFYNKVTDVNKSFLKKVTLLFIPMLNPDGANAYTRNNSKQIDLNRDAVALKAKESKLLRRLIDDFKPNYCFNLHDQRSIFNVSGTKKPATLSFLAPSEDQERTVTENRKKVMSVINGMHQYLKDYLPNQIGRYTDEFYPTATGDIFQKLGYKPILIESGYFKEDAGREVSRKFTTLALLKGIEIIANNELSIDAYKDYFKIPENDTYFLDYIYKNVKIPHKNKFKVVNIGVQKVYKREPSIKNMEEFHKTKILDDLETYASDMFIDAKGATLESLNLNTETS